MNRILLSAAGATLLAATANVTAAEAIEELVVTTSVTGQELQPFQVFGEEDLLTRRMPTIGETLDLQLGLSSSYFGPAASRPIIRGLGGGRVLMLTDLISTLDVGDLSDDHAVTVEPVLARSIEVIRGPSTLLYGSQAAGGVVNVYDGRVPNALPDEGIDGAAELRGDTASGEQAFVGSLDAALGPLALHLDAMTRETDDIEIPGFATADPDERPEEERSGTLLNSASETDSYAAGLSWVFDNGYVGASVSRLENTYGLPGPGEEEEGEEEPALFPGPFLDMEQTRVDLRGELRGDGFIENARFAFGVNDYEHTETEPSGEVGTAWSNEAWQGRVDITHAAIGVFSGTVGLQVDDRDFAAIGAEAFVNPVQTQSWGLFIAEKLGFDWGQVELGLRAEQLEHTPTELTGYDETAVSIAAGLAFDLTDELQLFGNLARTERNPSATELYSEGPHIATRQFEIGLLAPEDDPELAGIEIAGRAEKEVSVNLDVGLRGNAGAWGFEVGLFYNDIADYVYQDLSGGDELDGLPVAVYRQADAEFYGVEAEVNVRLGEQLPLLPELRVFTDFVNAELNDGSKLPRIPPLRFGAGGSIGGENWGVDLDLVYHDSQSDVSSFQTDSFTMLNLGGWYRLELDAVAVELFARGTNLLDEEARRSTSYLAAFAPLPGASLQAGARLTF